MLRERRHAQLLRHLRRCVDESAPRVAHHTVQREDHTERLVGRLHVAQTCGAHVAQALVERVDIEALVLASSTELQEAFAPLAAGRRLTPQPRRCRWLWLRGSGRDVFLGYPRVPRVLIILRIAEAAAAAGARLCIDVACRPHMGLVIVARRGLRARRRAAGDDDAARDAQCLAQRDGAPPRRCQRRRPRSSGCGNASSSCIASDM
mmetsp:Transcript_39310/g.116965  ORF Transcript_39310/g.116965 Transcript_39310/m.116965 type:complete len:206 (-) Transcript_39310:163-780(-)